MKQILLIAAIASFMLNGMENNFYTPIFNLDELEQVDKDTIKVTNAKDFSTLSKKILKAIKLTNYVELLGDTTAPLIQQQGQRDFFSFLRDNKNYKNFYYHKIEYTASQDEQVNGCRAKNCIYKSRLEKIFCANYPKETKEEYDKDFAEDQEKFMPYLKKIEQLKDEWRKNDIGILIKKPNYWIHPFTTHYEK